MQQANEQSSRSGKRALRMWSLAAGLVLFSMVGCGSGGPVGFVPGGTFDATPESAGPDADWSFVIDLDSVDVEVGGARPRTVRTGVVVRDGVVYLPVTGSPFKRWPSAVRSDPEIVLRAAGRYFALLATPIEDPEELAALRRAGQEKYGAPFHAKILAGWTQYFRLSPRGS